MIYPEEIKRHLPNVVALLEELYADKLDLEQQLERREEELEALREDFEECRAQSSILRNQLAELQRDKEFEV